MTGKVKAWLMDMEDRAADLYFSGESEAYARELFKEEFGENHLSIFDGVVTFLKEEVGTLEDRVLH